MKSYSDGFSDGFHGGTVSGLRLALLVTEDEQTRKEIEQLIADEKAFFEGEHGEESFIR